MTLRHRKSSLILALKAKKIAHKIPDEQYDRFELMYRQARSEAEQDQVTGFIDAFLNSWKTDGDTFSRLLRDVNDFGDDVIGDEDEDPPALREALARSRVTFSR